MHDKIKSGSVLDVGCGRGLWLAVAAELGATETIGIEGPWIEAQSTYIALDHILTRDLELGFDLNRSFDLVMSIEVGEHLSAVAAETFVTSLVRTRRLHLVLCSCSISTGNRAHQLPFSRLLGGPVRQARLSAHRFHSPRGLERQRHACVDSTERTRFRFA